MHAAHSGARSWDGARKNRSSLCDALTTAYNLGPNDAQRFALASTIAKFPRVPTPSKARTMAAANLLTPLIACLDPKRRFPVVNGEKGVRAELPPDLPPKSARLMIRN